LQEIADVPRPKILIVASWYPTAASPVGGIFIQHQARVLARQYEVAVLAPRVVGWREMLQRKLGAPSQFETEDGLLVCRERVLAPVPRAPALTYRRWLPAAEKGFFKLLARWGKPDLIHAQVVLPGGLAAVRFGKKQAIPVVLTEHSSPFSMHLKTAALRRWVRETLPQVDRLIAVSPALAQQIHSFDNSLAIHLLGNVVNTDFFLPAQNENPQSTKTTTRFLSVGLLTKQKGINFLLLAAQQLVQRAITDFELIIGGDGPERSNLTRLAQSLGLADHCRFLGLLTPAEVRFQMQQCDAVVMPSLHETFCLVLGEAMACGKPVIATRCGGPEFVVTPETGILVDVANPQALANGMSDFILGKVKFNSQHVRQSVVERFGEEAFLRQISAVYDQVWSKKNNRLTV
jgi:glycosyltransferase involved in cell wall biosynthesis